MPSRVEVYWCRLSSCHLCFGAHSCQRMELICHSLLIGINGVCSTWRYLPRVISHGLETLKEGRTTGILSNLILFDHLAPAISTAVRGYLNFTHTIWMRCIISVMPRENTATLWLMQHAGNNMKYAGHCGGSGFRSDPNQLMRKTVTSWKPQWAKEKERQKCRPWAQITEACICTAHVRYVMRHSSLLFPLHSSYGSR